MLYLSSYSNDTTSWNPHTLQRCSTLSPILGLLVLPHRIHAPENRLAMKLANHSLSGLQNNICSSCFQKVEPGTSSIHQLWHPSIHQLPGNISTKISSGSHRGNMWDGHHLKLVSKKENGFAHFWLWPVMFFQKKRLKFYWFLQTKIVP